MRPQLCLLLRLLQFEQGQSVTLSESCRISLALKAWRRVMLSWSLYLLAASIPRLPSPRQVGSAQTEGLGTPVWALSALNWGAYLEVLLHYNFFFTHLV